MHIHPQQRFTGRATDYDRCRPDYPEKVLPFLRRTIQLSADWVIVDVGAGSGISSAPFLDSGNTVFAVEPNAEMLAAARQRFAPNPAFHAVAASGEATGLPSASADLIVAAQAFHWLEPQRTAAEFRRILKPAGWCLLMWNQRRTEGSEFLVGYEALLRRFGTDYAEVSATYADVEAMRVVFGGEHYHSIAFPHEQTLDLPGLTGRLLSCSYVPGSEDSEFRVMLEELNALFAATHSQGQVTMEYDTQLFWGRLDTT